MSLHTQLADAMGIPAAENCEETRPSYWVLTQTRPDCQHDGTCTSGVALQVTRDQETGLAPWAPSQVTAWCGSVQKLPGFQGGAAL